MFDYETNPFSVTASLCAGPPGKLRVEYSFPYRKVLANLFRRFRSGTMKSGAAAYGSPVLEIDRAKLRRLDFSQQELAGIGFSLVRQLMILERYRGEDAAQSVAGNSSAA
ncbi:MAG TPA: hypothetical protein VN693_05045 [Rhodanobacteraceae bacterium]|nr:hypothetical protein [Rhodanobacteraceae bacterium]